MQVKILKFKLQLKIVCVKILKLGTFSTFTTKKVPRTLVLSELQQSFQESFRKTFLEKDAFEVTLQLNILFRIFGWNSVTKNPGALDVPHVAVVGMQSSGSSRPRKNQN